MIDEAQEVVVYTAKITGRMLDCLTLSVFSPNMTVALFLALWDRPAKENPDVHLSTRPEQLRVLMDRENISVVRVPEGWIATSEVVSLVHDQGGEEGHMVYEDDNAMFAEDLQVAVCRCIVKKHRGEKISVDPRLLVT